MKRLMDIFVAIICLLVFSPLMLSVALLIRIRMGAPVVFWQTRPGLNARPFRMAKFRTMPNIADSQGELLPDAERLTPLGSILRSTSVDELPGLWNVLKGDMSLVGPRPLLMEYLAFYSPEQSRRHEVRPGLTGWAQVNGRNALSWEEKFELDVWYVDNRNLWLDIKIIWQTLQRVVSRDGISATGDVTMPRFTGSAPKR